MSTSQRLLLAVIVAMVSVATPAFAIGDEPHQENSINLNPLGILFGNYALNYERLVAEQHGLLAEGTFSNASSGVTSSMDGGLALGYRWHWSKSQNSGFLGANLGYRTGTAKTTITSDGVKKPFDLTVSAPYAVLNVGRRFAWDFGLNVTVRIGLGRAFYSVSSTSTDSNMQAAVKSVQDLYNFIPVTLDGELSIGYDF